MTVVDNTSVTVSWNDLIIPDFSIDYYTVVYSRVSQQQNEEMSTSPATSGVGIDLDTTAIYQFQVFATVTVDGRTVDGESSSHVYFTRPRKKTCMHHFIGACACLYRTCFAQPLSVLIVVVQGVEVMVLNDTSVTVSWNEIPDFSIDYYTVIYSRVSEGGGRQNGEKSAQYPPPATSGVITDLDSTAIYQFQVFATVTVSGRTVDGERSNPVYFTIPCKKITDRVYLAHL